MPGENIYSWSTTAASNGTADSLINWQEGMPRDTVNNSSRSELAAHAKALALRNGSISTTGSPNAQAFTSSIGFAPSDAIPTGMTVRLHIGAGLTNTGSVTLNMDGIGAVTVLTSDAHALTGGEFVAGGYVDLLYNGTNWIFLYGREFFQNEVISGGGVVMGVQVFSTAGTFTYTPSAAMACCIIEAVGGGGGSGAVYGELGGYQRGYWAGGGGSGGYSRKLVQAADIGGGQTIIVGAGGAGGTYSSGPPTATDGAAGGDSSVGTLCIAHGGGGGGGSVAVLNPPSGAGGSGGATGIGDLVSAGSPGGNGGGNGGNIASIVIGGNYGGSSVLGGGGTAPGWVGWAHLPAAVNGNPGNNYGGGASGPYVFQSGAGVNGAAGHSGIVIITEYAGRGLPGINGAAGPPGPAGPSGPGTGDVLHTGTPAAGQLAQWTDAAHIQGIDPATVAFTTGDVKLTLKTAADTGWVLMNDGSIGDALSTATTRANADTQALFTLLWTNIPDTWCPVSGGRGATAAADFAAHKQLTLPRTLGRALACSGAGSGLSSRPLGSFLGEEAHTLTIGEMPSHNHPGSTTTANHITNDVNAQSGGDFGVYNGPATVTVAFQGGGTAHNVMQPSSFLNVMVKL